MLFYIISIFFQLLAGLLPIILFFRYFSARYLEVLILLISSFITTILVLYTYLNDFNNHLIFNIYIIIEFVCLTIFFLKISKHEHRFIYIISSLFFCVVTFIDFSKSSVLTDSAKLSCLTFILYSILYFIHTIVYKTNENDNLFRQIFSGAILFYNCSAFLLIYFIMELTNSNLWIVHNFIEGISKLLISYALWKLPKTSLFSI